MRATSGGAVALTVPRLLAARAGSDPRHVAISQGSDYLDLATWQRRTLAIAAGLLAAGVRPGDRVALLYGSRDWIAYARSYPGGLPPGPGPVPLSTRSAPPRPGDKAEHLRATAPL